MSAWMRFGWGVVALGWALVSQTQAGTITRGYRSGWGSGLDFSLFNQTTASPSWSHNSWPTTPTPTPSPTPPAPQLSARALAPPVMVITPSATLAPATTVTPVYILPASFYSQGNSGTSAVPAPAAQVIPPPPPANAYVNLGVGPYPDSDSIARGNPVPWFMSQNAQFNTLFGGSPSPQQQTEFAATVLQRVQQTFQMSGVHATITSDPSVPASHTLSLVSNSSALSLPAAIGMTYVGGNGLSFVDQQAPAARSVDQLEWITAHNIAHELMLAFGVGENYDASGTFIDARNAQWSMMTNPSSRFSDAAVQAMNLALAGGSGGTTSQLAQVIGPQPVPEPAALAVWALAALTVAGRLRGRGGRA